MDNNCTMCNYAQKEQLADKNGQAIVGQYQTQCLRFPPSAFMVTGPGGAMALASAFPIVNEHQVCSLFEARDESRDASQGVLSDDPLRLV